MTVLAKCISPHSLAQQEKRAKALRLRIAKLPYTEIAKQCGYYDRHTARRAVKLAMAEITAEPARELLQMELLTLEQLQQKAMAHVQRGDMNAIDKVLRVMQMRQQLLGLGKAENAENEGKITEVVIDRSILMDKREYVEGEIVEVDA